ncbi:MAG: hypothetical protein ACK4PR_08115, partial [Gammaproteobacteria bacterium]
LLVGMAFCGKRCKLVQRLEKLAPVLMETTDVSFKRKRDEGSVVNPGRMPGTLSSPENESNRGKRESASESRDISGPYLDKS